MSRTERIVIQDYALTWATEFEALRKVLEEHLAGEILGIEHVGSTSIVGMKAKPIIDIDIIIADVSLLDGVISKLAALGYRHLGNLGIEGREAFKESATSASANGIENQSIEHHLYVCLKGSVALTNHLALRDFLRKNPAKVAAYSQLKQELAAAFPYDMNAYIDGKTDFIVEILAEIGMPSEDIRLVEKQNRL